MADDADDAEEAEEADEAEDAEEADEADEADEKMLMVESRSNGGGQSGRPAARSASA
jgi:type VI secretion system protein VasJ